MADIAKAFPIEGGLSLDDEALFFYGTVDPESTSVGDSVQVPVGSIYFRRYESPPGTFNTNVWQRWGIGPNDWRKVFGSDFDPTWGPGQPLQMPWGEPVVNKNDWFSTQNITGQFAGYIWPFDLSVRELIIQTQSVSSSNQNIDLYLNGVYDRTLASFSKSQSPTTVTFTQLDWPIPAATRIQLRAGNSNGQIKDVLVNMLAERLG